MKTVVMLVRQPQGPVAVLPHRSPRFARRVRTAPGWLVLALALTGCSVSPTDDAGAAPVSEATDAAETTGDLTVVATTTILGEIAEQVVGGEGQVTTLLPRGADPHTFQPSARQVAQLQEADLVVTNGAGLESGLADALAEADAAGVPVFTAVDHVETLAFTGDHDHAGEEHTEEGHGDDEHNDTATAVHAASTDPHIWMDPERMADIATALGDELAQVDEGSGAMFRERAADHADELMELSTRITDQLADVPEPARTLITNHDALAYFADRYAFDIVGTVIPGGTTGAEPSAEDLETLAATIADRDVPAIFGETTQPVRLAEAVAAEVGRDVQVVELYTGSLGEQGSGAETYAAMMETNAARIAEALGT